MSHAAPIPEHPVGSVWTWKPVEKNDMEFDLRVVRVTKRTVKMEAIPDGWTITFHEKRKALRSPFLVRKLKEA